MLSKDDRYVAAEILFAFCFLACYCKCLPQERSRQLAVARDKLGEESEQLRRTAQALEATKEDLRTSHAALQLTAADNERLLAQIAEAKQMLRAAQVFVAKWM